jgi:hypothetical protein
MRLDSDQPISQRPSPRQKATKPRAAAATAANTPITFNALINNSYQPLTSHLRTEWLFGFRLADGTHSTFSTANSGNTLRGDSPSETWSAPDSTVSKRNHADKVKRGPG